MASEFLSRSDDLSEQVVLALLETDDPKGFALSLPGILDDALAEMERRFYREFKAKKFVGPDHADDRAIEIAGEVSNDYMIDADGEDFDTLLNRAFRLSQSVRPLFP
jgi:hypothetical protein